MGQECTQQLGDIVTIVVGERRWWVGRRWRDGRWLGGWVG